jgi:uncharacterized membrane protein (DUF4010 family)
LESQWFIGFAVALGIGLLIGVERERRKGDGPQRAAAGIRTFTLASLAGFTAITAGGPILFAVVMFAVSSLVALAYWLTGREDPGLTTEISLILTVLLGGLAPSHPVQAAAIGVATAILLAARLRLHRFVNETLSESELRDGLILAAATFVVLPLLPSQPIDPFGALNPRNIWTTAVLVMGISSAGYVAERLLGPKYGLAAAGLASGFVSSTATIGAMGTRARQQSAVLMPASVGAILSTVATVVQLAIVLGATSVPTLQTLAPALLLGSAAAAAYAIAFGMRRTLPDVPMTETARGRAFSPRTALLFAGTLAVVLLATALVGSRFGTAGIAVTAALAGLVDAHSPAIAVASLVATGHITPPEAVLPILLAFSTNAISKGVLAYVSGGTAFALRVVPGLALVAGAVWLGSLLF